MNCCRAQKENLRVNQSPQAYNYHVIYRGVILNNENMIVDNQVLMEINYESKLLIG